MIITAIYGGLGNQMFQYAWGKYLSEHNQTPLFLDTHFFEYVDDREYLLHIFDIKDLIISKYKSLQLKNKNRSLIKKCLLKTKLIAPTYITEDNFHLIHNNQDYFSNSIYLEGYWQSFAYMEKCQPWINQYFQPLTPVSHQTDLATQIASTNSVCVHIRRGDYVNNPKFNAVHGCLSLEYYQKATTYLKNTLNNPIFYLFSDDPEWVKSSFNIDAPCHIVEGNPPEKGYYDLALMKQARHFIIANSSFSWWAAYLGKASDKIICYPNQWLVNDPQPKALFGPDWKKF